VPHNTCSTLTTKSIRKCKKVSGLKRVPGKNYYKFVDAKFKNFDRFYTEEVDAIEKFRDPDNYHWKKIRKFWKANALKPEANVMVLSAGQNTICADVLQGKFKHKAYFMFSIRNPYAFCEGIRRRTFEHRDYHPELERAAMHWVKLLRWQEVFYEKLNNYVFFTYEELTENPKIVKNKLAKMLPELKDLTFNKVGSHTIEGKTKGLQNFNEKQIKCLSEADVFKINTVLKENMDLMDKLGYELIK
jgi:hypothetical protein